MQRDELREGSKRVIAAHKKLKAVKDSRDGENDVHRIEADDSVIYHVNAIAQKQNFWFL